MTGTVEVSEYHHGKRVGDTIRLSPDRFLAWRVRQGVPTRQLNFVSAQLELPWLLPTSPTRDCEEGISIVGFLESLD